MLFSLVDNAIAYSPDGSTVQVNASTSATESTLTVTDHGNGIQPGKLKILFQPFLKLEGAEAFNHEGMGFSLYLDKLIMTYLGGSIAMDSAPGKGTTVTLHLPAVQANNSW